MLKILSELGCWFGLHLFIRNGRLRKCQYCGYREYLFFKGYSFGRWVERWYPYKGPCTIDIDGFTYPFDADKYEDK